MPQASSALPQDIIDQMLAYANREAALNLIGGVMGRLRQGVRMVEITSESLILEDPRGERCRLTFPSPINTLPDLQNALQDLSSQAYRAQSVRSHTQRLRRK